MRKLTAVFALLFIFSGSLFSETGMVKISALSGRVDCSIGGSDWKPAVLNQQLTTADKVRTLDGKAELLFAEGTTIKLKENSVLDLLKIQCTVEKQNSSLKLLIGNLKAKVTKLSSGGSFDVQSPKIIAAVKGTEFIMITTGENTDVSVLEGVVSISDLLKIKEFFLKENERAAFRDGLLENPRQLDPSELQGLREGYDISRSGAPGRGAPGLGTDREKEAKELMDLRSDLAELKDRSNLEDKQDLLERISDVQLGKTMMDMHGYRVRTDNYILRPTPDTLQMLNITKREGGPDAGISSFEINDTFDRALPDNYMDVKIAIRDSTNGIVLKNGLPDRWLTNETAALRNPHGDVILDEVVLSIPALNGSKWEQPFNETFKINNNFKWSHDYSATFVETYTDNNPSGHVTTASTTLPYTFNASLTSDGGILFKDTYADSTYLEKYIYLINDAGAVQPLADLNKGNLVWEMIYKAPEFGLRSIDLIVIPAIFGELF